ncbi:synaptogyrin-2a [Osmerus mordax]|uniref:synaptogyrin-2a n=1 Tax=Osmerus mordax TaxID=8014 RepID=UPI00350F6934
MESSAFGASLAGGAFDLTSFVKQPQTIVRILSWLFSIVVFATITGEGFVNKPSSKELNCMFNQNENACNFGLGIGVLAFLACVIFLVLDAYLPQISNAKERKHIVTADLAFSGLWAFLWFICFCVLANQWSHSNVDLQNVGDAARAVVTFSFFSIFTWGLLALFAYKRFKQGVSDFDQGYTDPANDNSTPYPPTYPPYPNSGPEGYQQSPFSQASERPGEYQPPAH